MSIIQTFVELFAAQDVSAVGLFIVVCGAFGAGEAGVILPNSIITRPAVAILDPIAWRSRAATNTNLVLEGIDLLVEGFYLAGEKFDSACLSIDSVLLFGVGHHNLLED